MKGAVWSIWAVCLFLGGCLLFMGFFGAESMVTTISTDGSALLSTSGMDSNGTFASRTMIRDASNMTRSVTGADELTTDLIVQSAGPVLFQEYASGIMKRPEIRDLCAFLYTSSDRTEREASEYLSGIVSKGEIETSRIIGSGLTAVSAVNGSGLLILGSEVKGNRSMQSRGFVTGNMSVHDRTRYGGRW